MSDKQQDPSSHISGTCPGCGGQTEPDGKRPGWTYCPACRWPAWMPLNGGWVATPAPSDQARARFEAGLARIIERLASVR